MIASSAYASVHAQIVSDITDTWYTINDTAPCIMGLYYDSQGANSSWSNLEYYQNDQFLAGFYNAKDDSDSVTGLYGSYLFDQGVFIGIKANIVDNYTGWLISPGYRFAFDKKSYVALSLDYNYNNQGQSEVSNIGVDAKIFTNKLKFKGGLSLALTDEPTTYDFQVNYKLSDKLTIGGAYENEGSYSVGGSYATNSLVVDGQLGYASESFYAGSGMFMMGAFGLGAEYYKESEADGQITLKTKYNVTEQSKLVLFYTLESGAGATRVPSSLIIAYKTVL
ncbi:MAG TPA: hypothetical protein VHY08_24930 [Bacillota bacterium]|nr:hypothetical protein [Bacillota bacterium]